MRFVAAIALLILAVLFAVQTARAQDDTWIRHALKQQRIQEARWHYYARWDDDDDWRYYRPRIIIKKDAELQWAQQRLAELDYPVEPDGFMGPQTRFALSRFQSDYDLPVTGVLDTRTKEALYEARRDDGEHSKMGWAQRPQVCELRDGRQCTCQPIMVFTGEHKWIDAKEEGKQRWRGHVRSVLGELWTDWKSAVGADIQCWNSTTGERLTDGKQERCMVQAHACLATGSLDDRAVEFSPKKAD